MLICDAIDAARQLKQKENVTSVNKSAASGQLVPGGLLLSPSTSSPISSSSDLSLSTVAATSASFTFGKVMSPKEDTAGGIVCLSQCLCISIYLPYRCNNLKDN